MMLDGSSGFFAAMSLLLAMGQGCAQPPSPEAVVTQKVTRPDASATAPDSSRAGLADRLPTESTGASSFAATGAGESLVKDCDTLPLEDKEACYASYDKAALAECEQVRLYSCAPYARMHLAEVELKQIGEALLQSVREAYTSFEDNQPGYVKDVERAYAAADSAWRTYRDAHCTLEPVVQGMSRQEAPGLTEVCRAGMTEARVKELKEQESTLFAEGASDDERK
jgi:hypothetical protein